MTIRQTILKRYNNLDELYFSYAFDKRLNPSTQLPNITARTIYGQTGQLVANVTEDVWNTGGTRLDLNAVGETLDIVSTSANDAPAGSGLDAIVVRGLDVDGIPVEEIVILNGLTPVTSARLYTFIYEVAAIKITATGSVNAGDITLDGTDSGNPQGTITAGRSLMQNSHFKIPTDYTALFTQAIGGVEAFGGSGTKAAIFQIKTKTSGVVYTTIEWQQSTNGAGAVLFPLKVPIVFEAGTIVWTTAKAENNNTKAQTNFEFILVRDNINIQTLL